MPASNRTPFHRILTTLAGGAVVGLAVATAAPDASAAGACSTTSRLGLIACRSDVRDDYFEALGICTNLSDSDERDECNDDASDDRSEARVECREIYQAREEVCDQIGQAPYDPEIDPNDFTDVFANQNDYWPLAVDNQWVYEGGDELITVNVLDETKLIQGVTCIVVNDVVEEDGTKIEDTDDWYGVHDNGNVRYMGEIAENFESFEGDDPDDPELVDIEGSWKADRDGAKSGILMFAAPMVGQVYRQEWAFGDAEDMGEVIATDYDYGDGGDLNEMVPQELAELMCDSDCVVTRDYTPLEPGVEELKYYAKGIGLFLEVNVEEDEIVELVSCNLEDARCDAL